jgi:hypothetical protein
MKKKGKITDGVGESTFPLEVSSMQVLFKVLHPPDSETRIVAMMRPHYLCEL